VVGDYWQEKLCDSVGTKVGGNITHLQTFISFFIRGIVNRLVGTPPLVRPVPVTRQMQRIEQGFRIAVGLFEQFHGVGNIAGVNATVGKAAFATRF
jgi:hypothetical protein